MAWLVRRSPGGKRAAVNVTKLPAAVVIAVVMCQSQQSDGVTDVSEARGLLGGTVRMIDG